MRGVLARADGLADFAQAFVFEITQENGAAVGFVEGLHRFIEQRFDVSPDGLEARPTIGVHGIHLGGNLLAELASRFPADYVHSGTACDLIKPRRQNGVWFQLVSVSSEVGEHGLSDFLGQFRGADLTQRRGIGQV